MAQAPAAYSPLAQADAADADVEDIPLRPDSLVVPLDEPPPPKVHGRGRILIGVSLLCVCSGLALALSFSHGAPELTNGSRLGLLGWKLGPPGTG